MEKGNKVSLLDFNIKRYLHLCVKYWYLFAACIAVFVGLALAWTLTKGPIVTVMAQLMLKDDTSTGSMFTGDAGRALSLGGMFGGSSSTDNESAVLNSHAVFLNTVKNLDLCSSYAEKRYGFRWIPVPLTSPVKLIVAPEMADTISVGIVFKVKRLNNGNIDVVAKHKFHTLADLKNQSLPVNVHTDYGDFIINKTQYFDTSEYDNYRITFGSYNAAAERYAKLVKVFVPDRKTDFIDLSFNTPSAEFGKMLLNNIIQNYEAISDIYRLQRSNSSLDVVDRRLESLTKELEQSSLDVEKFKKENNISSVEGNVGVLLSKSSTLDGSLLKARTNLEIIKIKRDFLADPNNKYALIPELEIGLSGDLGEGGNSLSKYNNMLMYRISLLRTATPDNTQLKNLEENIELSRKNIVATVDRQYENALLAYNDLLKERNKTQSNLDNIPSIERSFREISRDNKMLEEVYLFLIQKREELNLSLSATSLPAQVIDAPHALVDGPGLTPFMASVIAAFMACLLVAAYIFFFKMKRTPVTAASEIDSQIKVPVLETVTHDDSTGGLAILADSAAAEPLRHLRADVQFALKGCDGKVVAVTSVNDDEGRTFIASNLAASLALIGNKVLVVDADLRDPQLAKALEMSGSSEYASRYVFTDNGSLPPVTAVSLGSTGATIDVIADAKPHPRAADAVASVKFADMINSIKAAYDYVIIDSARIKGQSDIYYVTDVADITLVVCRACHITPDDVKLLNEIFSSARLKRMAVVKNDFK